MLGWLPQPTLAQTQALLVAELSEDRAPRFLRAPASGRLGPFHILPRSEARLLATVNSQPPTTDAAGLGRAYGVDVVLELGVSEIDGHPVWNLRIHDVGSGVVGTSQCARRRSPGTCIPQALGYGGVVRAVRDNLVVIDAPESYHRRNQQAALVAAAGWVVGPEAHGISIVEYRQHQGRRGTYELVLPGPRHPQVGDKAQFPLATDESS